MIFLRHQAFPSDVVVALTTARARLQIFSNSTGLMTSLSMIDFLQLSLDEFQANGMMIVSVVITEAPRPTVGEPTLVTETFRIAQRARNAHAHVNAGFHLILAPRVGPQMDGPPVVLGATMVFGGVSKKTFEAVRASEVVTGAALSTATLQATLAALQEDLAEVGVSEEYGNQAFRESTMQTFVYKAFLRCFPVEQLPSSVSGIVTKAWAKPAFQGSNEPETISASAIAAALAPADEEKVAGGAVAGGAGKPPKSAGFIGKAVGKLDAASQTTGEQVYVSDEGMASRGLYGAIVFATRCATVLVAIDSSEALAMPGVELVLTAADIPPGGANALSDGTPLFVAIGAKVMHVGAPYAVVLATSEAAANAASAMVKAIYADGGTLKEDVEQNENGTVTTTSAATSASASTTTSATETTQPLVSLKQAMALDAFAPLPPIPNITFLSRGTKRQIFSHFFPTVQFYFLTLQNVKVFVLVLLLFLLFSLILFVSFFFRSEIRTLPYFVLLPVNSI